MPNPRATAPLKLGSGTVVTGTPLTSFPAVVPNEKVAEVTATPLRRGNGKVMVKSAV
jgi:hypothetical protein